MLIENIIQAFLLGVLTPLTAVCVLPLYPAFLSYLSKQLNPNSQDKNQILKLGILVGLGVISFMFLIGLLFTTFLQVSLTKVIGIVTPIAFGILILISVGLIFDIKPHLSFTSKIKRPETKNPKLNAYLYGFFFGSIVIPCNPLLIAALFTKSLTIVNFLENMLTFLFFGIGISAPLIVFAILSQSETNSVMNFLVEKSKIINRISGILLLTISLYYLIFVFKIFG